MQKPSENREGGRPVPAGALRIEVWDGHVSSDNCRVQRGAVGMGYGCLKRPRCSGARFVQVPVYSKECGGHGRAESCRGQRRAVGMSACV